ncbi:MAG: response regulator [Spirochaetes bacterium]|nr:response regulator [Spirochaetota bacterium]
MEDEGAIADTIIYALETAGFEPVWVSTGNEGLKAFQKQSMDLIIIDIGLPDITGFEFLKKIRLQSEIPALFLTARTDEQDKIDGLELGADDYITKPFSPREMVARVKAHLRRGSLQQTNGTNADSQENKKYLFMVDENRKTIFYCDKDLSLSFREFKIMQVFLSQPGWVFSRERILELVWDDEGDVYDRTIDAHIKSIRIKLKEVTPDFDPIHTHRGFGYSIKEF